MEETLFHAHHGAKKQKAIFFSLNLAAAAGIVQETGRVCEVG